MNDTVRKDNIMAMKKIEGPYQVRRDGSVFEVVYLEGETNYIKLLPHRTYSERSNACRRAGKLNRQWQRERENQAI